MSEMNLEQVSASKYFMRAHDTHDMFFQDTALSQARFNAVSGSSYAQQQRYIVENTPREAAADAAALRNTNATDVGVIMSALGSIFGDNGMKYKYAYDNPVAPNK